MTETIRIGSPPQAPPGQPRRNGPPWLVVVAAVAFIAAAGALVVSTVTRYDKPPVATPTSAPSSPSGVDTRAEFVTCYALVPVLDEGATEVNLIFEYPDRSTATIAADAGQLRVLEDTAPAGWRPDIATQYQVLEQVVAAHGDRDRLAAIDAGAFAESGTRLVRGCLPYTVS